MNIQAFSSTRPNFVDRALSGFKYPNMEESERELAMHADHLDKATAESLDQALLLPTPQARAKAFADAVSSAQGQSDVRCCTRPRWKA